MDLGRVSTFTLQKFRKVILDKGRTVATANRVVATWNHMAGWLFDNGKIGAPLPRMKSTKEDNRRDFIFTADAETAILDAAAKDVSPRIWLFMKMGFATSMRHSEILSARFDKLDVDRRRLRVKVKGGRWREQPLPADLAEILKKERDSADDPKGWIFPSRQTKAGHATTMRLAFRRCAIAAKLDPDRATPHALRHTAVTRFSAAVGGDAAMVQRFSGHQSLAMLLRYTHPADERVDATLDTMRDGPKEASVVKHPKASEGQKS
jgi:integrase